MLDWRPFDYFTVEERLLLGTLTVTSLLEPRAAGTRLHVHAQLTPTLPLPGPLRRRMVGRLAQLNHTPEGYGALVRLLNDVLARRSQHYFGAD